MVVGGGETRGEALQPIAVLLQALLQGRHQAGGDDPRSQQAGHDQQTDTAQSQFDAGAPMDAAIGRIGLDPRAQMRQHAARQRLVLADEGQRRQWLQILQPRQLPDEFHVAERAGMAVGDIEAVDIRRPVLPGNRIKMPIGRAGKARPGDTEPVELAVGESLGQVRPVLAHAGFRRQASHAFGQARQAGHRKISRRPRQVGQVVARDLPLGLFPDAQHHLAHRHRQQTAAIPVEPFQHAHRPVRARAQTGRRAEALIDNGLARQGNGPRNL